MYTIQKILLIIFCISILKAEKLEIPSIDIITQLRHIVSKLNIKVFFVAPNFDHVPRYSKFWCEKFVSNSIDPSIVIKEFFDKKSFYYHFENKILYVDFVNLSKKDKEILSSNLEYFKKNSTSEKGTEIIIARKSGNDFFIRTHKYPPSFHINSFLENLKKVKVIAMKPKNYDNYLDIDYVTYPISYFMTFRHREFINALEEDNIFSVRDISYDIKLDIWEIIYQHQSILSLDYLMNSFYHIKFNHDLEGVADTLIRGRITGRGFIPNPDIYEGRYSINGSFSDIAKRIYNDYPSLAIEDIEKHEALKDSVEYYQNEIKEILDKRFNLDELSEKQLYTLNNLHKVVIKFWPNRYRTIRINHLFEIEDKLDYLIDMAETVDQLEDWFSLITIKE